MKACLHCGHSNQDFAEVCYGCGGIFTRRKTPISAVAPLVDFSILKRKEFEKLDLGFEMVEGFSRPDWKSITRSVKEQISDLDFRLAWDYIAIKWLRELASDLGGSAQVCESKNFLLLSDLDAESVNSLLKHAESSVKSVRSFLKDTAWSGYHGRHVLLIFSELDDYYAYTSYFYPEGENILSKGVFLKIGYAHIALPFSDLHNAQRTIIHELVHNLLAHLRIPRWLNEGLAIGIQKQLSNQRFRLDRELVNRHRDHWNEDNILHFWSGRSFQVAGDPSELSYSLSEILLHSLIERKLKLSEFVKSADWRDGGQDAALNYLNLDLGEVAGGFLGPGNWRPSRKAIAELFPEQKSS